MSLLIKSIIFLISFTDYTFFLGQIDLLDSNVIDCEAIFSGCHALIYIIDSHVGVSLSIGLKSIFLINHTKFMFQQDDYADSLDIMRAIVTRAYSVNPNINFEIFIHKVLHENSFILTLRCCDIGCTFKLYIQGICDPFLTGWRS